MNSPGESAVGTRGRSLGAPRRIVAAVLAMAILGMAGWMVIRWRRAASLWDEAQTSAYRRRWPDAERALARLAWYRPGDSEALRLRAKVALALGDQATAIRWLSEDADRSPSAADSRFLLGRLLLERFRAREAEAAFRAGLACDPGHVEARRWLIILLGIQRRKEEQAEALWALHDRGGHELEALHLLSHAAPVIPHGGLSKTTDEGQVLERCLAADPDDPHARPALARYVRGRGRVAEALRSLESWLAAHPGDAAAALERLECLAEQDEDRAGPELERTDGPASSLAGFWSLRGDWLLRRDRADDAIASLGRAIALDPLDASAHYRLGQALRAAGRPGESDRELRWAADARALIALAHDVPDHPTDPVPLLDAGRLCRSMGRSREALGWLAQALRIDPSNRDARSAYDEAKRPPNPAS